jgi:nitroimidazol reductase NimA-like FMN-containing flavoprotein (pyridoxamine 5'-phosphate oxidase superfamily)
VIVAGAPAGGQAAPAGWTTTPGCPGAQAIVGGSHYVSAFPELWLYCSRYLSSHSSEKVKNMTREQRQQFVLDHRTAIFGYNRAKDGPAMSIVFYCIDQDEILVSTMAERAKAKAVARSPKVSLCVLDEQWPPSYLQVYCDAVIDTDFDSVVDVMMRIAGVMAGTPMSEDVRPMVAEGARQEKRVALRLRPYATFYTPPRHVHSEADVGPGLRHETSASIPW